MREHSPGRVTDYLFSGGIIVIVATPAGAVESDWFKNAKAHPRVHIRVGSREFDGIAEAVTDPCRIADLIRRRLFRHRRIIGAILAAEGLPRNPTREELEAHARTLAMLIVRPIE